MNTELLNKIKADIKMWNNTKSDQLKCLQRVRKYFVAGLNDVIATKFGKSKSHPMAVFVGMGGCNIVVRIGKQLFRISYDEAVPEYVDHVKYEFDVLTSHDFGILAPIDYAYKSPNIWWHEIREAFRYDGATLAEYSKLLHKVIKLSKYNLYWFDIHNGNMMRDKMGNLVIADFDTSNVDGWVTKHVKRYKNIKLSEIKKYLDSYIGDWHIMNDLRFMIFAYLKLPVTNENWMKFCFGEFMYKSKYNITNCYTTALLDAQIKNKGDIGF